MWLTVGATLGSFALLFWTLWWGVHQQMRLAPRFRITPQSVLLEPPPPAWVPQNLTEEVLAQLQGEQPLSLLDEDLGRKFYELFSIHPWIARVERVVCEAGPRVRVQVRYRKPVLMVEVPGGLLPVDEQGVLLPSEDFTPEQALRYPRLAAVGTQPSGPPGAPWGDARVHQAAQLASVLLDVWRPWGLDRLVVRASDATNSEKAQAIIFEIYTRHGSRIVWGTVDSADSLVRRRAVLEQLLRQLGTLDDPQRPRLIDLSVLHQPRVKTLQAQAITGPSGPKRK